MGRGAKERQRTKEQHTFCDAFRIAGCFDEGRALDADQTDDAVRSATTISADPRHSLAPPVQRITGYALCAYPQQLAT
ncbi:hypothetical protein FH972_023692 [Carpinus fangiana]|uniref:Uncharacterized protein n=1 Tax=Carpinus fangiana TaxID=176857 RepID=A0A5N6KVX6_9ROSI|nr:hypothetical protein FH972_023692 [Carpinus fangiana]